MFLPKKDVDKQTISEDKEVVADVWGDFHFHFLLFKKGRDEITIVLPYKGCGEGNDKW